MIRVYVALSNSPSPAIRASMMESIKIVGFEEEIYFGGAIIAVSRERVIFQNGILMK